MMRAADTRRAIRKRPSPAWRDLFLVALLVLAGAVLRLVYLDEIRKEAVFHAPVSDAAFHDYWAKGIASGEWAPPAGNPDPRIREVPFLRPPGYAYFLALVYAVFGPEPHAARVVQMALGLLSSVLAFLLGRALLGRATGILLAAFCALYWGFVYFEAQLHAPSVIITLSFALLLLLRAWARRPGIWKAALAGVLTGLLALFRAETLLFIPVAAIWIGWISRRTATRRAAFVPIAAFLLGSLAGIAPATIRNLIVSKEPVLISANGPINLYVGNNETSDGVTTRIPDLAEVVGTAGWSCFSYDQIVLEVCRKEGRPATYTEASRIFTSKALDFIGRRPLRFILLTLKRAALFWGPEEVANNTAIRFEKGSSRVLRWIPGFPLVVAPSLLGLAFLLLGWRERRRAPLERGAESRSRTAPEGDPTKGPMIVLVGSFVLSGFVALLPFIAAARFRAPYAPFIFLFGAYGIARLGALAAGRRWRPFAVTGVLLAALFALASLPVPGYRTDAAWWRTDRGLALWRAERSGEAIEEFEEALRANPGFVDAHVNLGGILAETGRSEEAIRHWRSVLDHRPERVDVRFRLGKLLLESGRAGEAARELREVVERNPRLAEGWFELGRALIEVRDFAGSREAFDRSLELLPDEPGAFVNQAIALRQSGKAREALNPLQRAIQIKPDYALAYFHLGQTYGELGESDRARSAFQEVIRLEPRNPDPLIHIGILASREGDIDGAIRWFRQAIAIDPNSTTAHYNLGGMLGMKGLASEARAEFETVLRIDPSHGPAQRQIQALRSRGR
jgi:tetratricopeptide (TPR) repeat protein